MEASTSSQAQPEVTELEQRRESSDTSLEEESPEDTMVYFI